jgi:hypothetical protein
MLDFTTLTTQELEAYFNEGALKHAAGYSDYESEFRFQDSQHFKDRITSFLGQGNFNKPMNILELGGARGHRAEYALDAIPNIRSWEIIDLYDSPLKRTHAELTYTIGDANALIADTQAYKSNSKDVICSFRFLECIPEANIPDLVGNMNRVAKTKQFHVTGMENIEYYSPRDLTWWAAQGFASGTILLDHKDFQHGKFENVVVV